MDIEQLRKLSTEAKQSNENVIENINELYEIVIAHITENAEDEMLKAATNGQTYANIYTYKIDRTLAGDRDVDQKLIKFNGIWLKTITQYNNNQFFRELEKFFNKNNTNDEKFTCGYSIFKDTTTAQTKKTHPITIVKYYVSWGNNTKPTQKRSVIGTKQYKSNDSSTTKYNKYNKNKINGQESSHKKYNKNLESNGHDLLSDYQRFKSTSNNIDEQKDVNNDENVDIPSFDDELPKPKRILKRSTNNNLEKPKLVRSDNN